MKKNYLLICLLLLSGFTSQAQLRVLSNGRVQAGLLKDANEDPGNVTQMQIFGQTGDMRAGSKLSFGDFGLYANQGWNVFIGEYGTSDTDKLWLHGKLGIYLTTNGYGSNVVAYYDPSLNSNFVFNTNLRVNGVNITSDARLKENVQSLKNPLKLLNKLSGVSYTYSLSEIQKNRKQDESKFADISGTGDVNPSDSKIPAGVAGHPSKDNKKQEQINRKEAEDAARKRIGFLAQDIQKIFPELVQTDENGIMSIDYIGFIPIIVESIKEMQQTIDNQNELINSLISSDEQFTFRSNPTSNEDINILEGAKLYPRDGASVGYTLPANSKSANLQIYDISGKTVKAISLNFNNEIVDISSSEIGLGTFVYALFVDGQKRDVLKKIVNR